MAQFVRPVSHPSPWPPSAVRGSALLDYARERDPIGDRVHMGLACICFLCMPWSSTVASISLIVVMVYGLLRIHATWGAVLNVLCRPVGVLLLVLACWCLLSLMWTTDPDLGLKQARKLRWLALPLAVWPVIHGRRWFFICLLLGVLLLNISQLIAVIEQWTQAKAINVRSGGALSQPTIASLWSAVGLVGWLALLVLGRCGMMTLSGAGVLLALTGIGAGGGRAALLAAAIGVVAFGLLCWFRNRTLRKRLVWCAVFALASAAVLSFSLSGPITNEFKKLQRGLSVYLETGNAAELHMSRLLWTERSIAYWVAAPLAGHGLGSYATLSFGDPVIDEQSATAQHNPDLSRAVFHPHSIYLSSLVETGLVGFGLLLSLLAFVGRQCWRVAADCDWSLALAPMFLVWIVAGVFDSLLYIGLAASLFAAIVTLSLRQPEASTIEQSDRQAQAH